MSNYVQSTNFATKDALASGDALKIVRGTEINTEFNNIATAVATKADSNSPTLSTPTLVAPALGTPVSGNLANCTFPTLNQSTTGNAATATLATNATNAATATALQTARTIGGVSFNGTADINLPGVNTSGNQNTTGNAATATQLTTASGSAASFSARAFVAFNPAASVQFANGGVSSINNLASQVFQINFSTNMPDTNYTIVCTSSTCFDAVNFTNQGVMMQTAGNATRLVSSCQIRAVKDDFANPSSSAPEYIGVAIFR